ncbi:MAG: hypothetical protein ABW075_10410 [Aeromicrobium sp.]
MRTRTGWALAVLGVLVAVLGAAVMVVLGPDSRFTTGPHAIETDTIAVVTAPAAISWADVQVDLLAEVPVRKPIFIGVGNAVDVQDYVSGTRRLEVTSFRRPWTLTSREVEGKANLPGAPTALDWWIDSSAGLGGASISTRLPDETVSVAILSVGSSNLSGLQVTVAYGVKDGFAKGRSLLLLGLGVLVLGLVVRRRPSADDDPAADVLEDESVVYVYVDDDGVEHEISAEEAADLDVVEEVVVVDERDPDPEPDPVDRSAAVAPVAAPVRVAGVLTAAEIAAAEPATDPVDQEHVVVYVYVDDDGVEHEVSEAELAEFEILDEEETT